jgi:hypothetical protein
MCSLLLVLLIGEGAFFCITVVEYVVVSSEMLKISSYYCFIGYLKPVDQDKDIVIAGAKIINNSQCVVFRG